MVSQNWSRRTLACLASLVVFVGLLPSSAAAQYAVTNLVSNQKGKAEASGQGSGQRLGNVFFLRRSVLDQ